jgi:hypothetical protein
MFPLLFFSEGFCHSIPKPDRDNKGELNAGAIAMLVTTIMDVFIVFSMLLVAILGSSGVVSPAAAYACLAVGVACITSWVVLGIRTKGEAILGVRNLFADVLHCNKPAQS